MVRNLKRTFCMFLGMAAFGCFASSIANAQHIVTEAEAGKLTLASLTAVPAAHHVHRHNTGSLRKARVRTISYQRHADKVYSGLVHRVSYSHKPLKAVKIKSAVYDVSARKKIKSRRHRS